MCNHSVLDVFLLVLKIHTSTKHTSKSKRVIVVRRAARTQRVVYGARVTVRAPLNMRAFSSRRRCAGHGCRAKLYAEYSVSFSS